MPQEIVVGIGITVATAIVIVVVAMRLSLARRQRALSAKIAGLAPYHDAQGGRGAGEEERFVDIYSELRSRFRGRAITHADEERFTHYYSPLYDEALTLAQQLKRYLSNPTGRVAKFIHDYERIGHLVKLHNDHTYRELLHQHKDFFDHCLKYPLDLQQRRSIVAEEDNCLVVSSAGSGKTSSIVGKVLYLIEKQHVDPQRILLISYTNKAAAELTERTGIAGLRGYTFHKLALDIVGQATGQKPSILDNADALFVRIYHNLLTDEKFRKSVLKYFFDYQTEESEEEKRKNERRQQLTEQKSKRLKAQLPDMDGNTFYVRSEQELKISYALCSLGVKFRYEESYEHQLADEMHSQYKPDFSIYYEKDGQVKRLYLEHFGVDEHSLVPAWFAMDKNISYEEANERYNDGITWKRAAHQKFGTRLITTCSADFHYFADIRNKLRVLLQAEGVKVHEKTEAELYDMVLPSGGSQEKAFIRLVVTFVTLVKSSCKSIDDILRQAKREDDERSTFIIGDIFLPVYKEYVRRLAESQRIDFTDAILQATDICLAQHPVTYDHIIVDEFQDISVDRYRFLKALRESNPPAKLYCVGDDWQSIYRFSGSDMALFNHFPDYFGFTEINKIETTYRFGEPLVSLSSEFIQRNAAQVRKTIRPFDPQAHTDLQFVDYNKHTYCTLIGQLVASVPPEKTILLLGRYTFDDYYLSFGYRSVRQDNRFYYLIGDRRVEFLTVHKSKGLEADYVIVLQCNRDVYGFPSLVSDDPVLDYVLTRGDEFPYGEERRLFYVAITRAKVRTWVMYDRRIPSVFVDEFQRPSAVTEESYSLHRNANKRWTPAADNFLLALRREGKSIRYISQKMGRSQTSIVMRLGKLEDEGCEEE